MNRHRDASAEHTLPAVRVENGGVICAERTTGMRHQATGCVERLGQALADTQWAGNLCQLPQLNHVHRERQKLNQSPALISSWQYLCGSRAFGTGTILLSSRSMV